MTAGRAPVEPIDIGKVAQPPFARLPDLNTVFDRRARRLEALGEDHALGDFLRFVASLARAQDAVVRHLPPGTLPGPDQVALCHEHQLPLIDRLTWRRDEFWQVALAGLLDAIADAPMPPPAAGALARLRHTSSAGRDLLADRILGGSPDAEEAAAACFVTAALQVYWARMAALLDAPSVKPIDPPGACPVCGSAAFASMVYAEGSLQAVRFLICPLCASEWHSVRIKCVHCQSTKGIAFQQIEGQPSPVKAETCDECRTYTKILYQEKAPEAEPLADDLASFALDVLVEEAGWSRAAPNPFLTAAAGSDTAGHDAG